MINTPGARCPEPFWSGTVGRASVPTARCS